MENKKITLLGNIEFCMWFYILYHKLLDIDKIITPDKTDDYKEILNNSNIDIIPFNVSVFDKYNEYTERLVVVCEYDILTYDDKRKYDDFLYTNGFVWGADYVDALYVQLYFSNKIKQNMKNKDIWIFGAGNNGRDFYNNHRNLNICGFISNYENEHEFCGLPVLRPNEVFLKSENIYVAICSDAAAEMANMCEQYHFSIIENYCANHQYFEKLFIAIGTCHIREIMDLLVRNKDFMKKHTVVRFFRNMYDDSSFADKIRINNYGKFCEAVFYDNDSFINLNKGIIDRFYSDAVKMYMPFYVFRGQHMQMTHDENKHAVKIIGDKYIYWLRGDKEVNRLIEENVDKETIINKVSSEDYWTKEEILNNWDKEIRQIKILDELSDLKILSFIQENYKEKLLFRDSIHFSADLNIYLCNQIADILKFFPFTESEEKQLLHEYYTFNSCIRPIYPCVAKTLGLSFIKPDTKYGYMYRDEKPQYFNFKEYIEIYINYVYFLRKWEPYSGI